MMGSSQKISTVCVVGAGSAGLLSAITLKHFFPQLRVSLVYSSDVPIIGVGESTTPFIPRHLHQYLGIDYDSFFREVKPSWKLGIRYEWGPPEKSHFNYSFDSNLQNWHPPLPLIDGYYCIEDLRAHAMRAAMMEQGCSPVLLTPKGVCYDEGSAYHLDNKLFIEYLTKVAKQRGVKFIDAKIEATPLDTDGSIKFIQLEGERKIRAQLYIDCSGFRSLLLEKALKEKKVSYRSSLFCDRAVVGSYPRETGDVMPYTTAETMDNGWCWKIEFENLVTRGYVYSSDFCDEEQAAEEFQRKNPQIGEDLRFISFPSGRYENFWVKNVAAIGNASGFVEPLEATALHHIIIQLQSLVQGLKEAHFQFSPALQRLQNARYRDLWDDTRDFLSLHYRFNQRLKTDFWLHCQNETDIAGAKSVVELYQEIGPSRRLEDVIIPNSIFGYSGYITMLGGQNVPVRIKPEITDQHRQQFTGIRQQYVNNAKQAINIRDAFNLIRCSNWEWPKQQAPPKVDL